MIKCPTTFMSDVSARSSRSIESPTLGRLGGLAATEVDRGEKALWLAGGGYRAALFHLGALTRLNELGLLARTGAVGAVSGGSIVAALLATGVSWPLDGGCRDWPERVAEPMRAIARRNARARSFLRRPFPAARDRAALEERYARKLVDSLGGEPARGPRFAFGASGLILSGLAAGWEDCVEWDLGGCAHPPGYERSLVAEVIAAVRTDLDAFGEAEQAVLENHGYLLADAALRERGLVACKGIEPCPPQPPHPRWMNEERVRGALEASARRTAVGRLRPRRARWGGRE
ncbi:MAG: patatin-like phospholipase family protein, partial [Solirubrobacterales bacterium]